jgi:molecular chaperone DnaK (HSP70)
MSSLRYAVGIDLGTSNTALAYADLNEQDPRVRVFEVPQLVAPQDRAPRSLLPSHLYLPSSYESLGEIPVVGLFARERGAQVPGRHVASAKSWLCHPSVDRTARILPWGAPPDVPRLSPVDASARILSHLREAWDAAHPDAPLAEQDVIVTVPASFDEGARALTLQAAAHAGLPRLLLVEEPQAAFYDWVRVHRAQLHEELKAVHLLLVVDVGGGTTDLTLIKTDASHEEAPPKLERIAVGDHLLLGGDNMDLALARTAEARLGRKLDAAQFGALVSACRAAKELMLRDDAPERTSVTVPGSGSRLVGGAITVEIQRDEARKLLFEGFFPQVAATDMPAKATRAAGLAELGLPYAADPAITKHAAAFLQRHARTAGDQRVDAVLYNGGALAPALLADRLTSVIESWQRPEEQASPATGGGRRPEHWRLRRLRNDAPDLAVARGAAQYALVRRGLGLRIGGGSPRTYFVGVGIANEAVCVVPRGAGEGVPEKLARDFSLVLGRPVRFRLFTASEFRKEQPGDLVSSTEGLQELPPLQTVIEGEGTAPVRLTATLTEIGTLEVFCEGASQRWKLEFQLRGGEREAGAVSQLPRTIDAAREALQTVFGKKPVQGANAKDTWRNLEKVLGDRSNWSLATLRDLWGVLWAGAQKRRRTDDHERMFLSLSGFLLRPGFGAPLDQWRVEQTFSLFSQGLTHHKDAAVWSAWWILWRRIAAGLPEASHVALFEAIAPHLRPKPVGRVANPGKKPPGLAPDEMVRLLGALERLPVATKMEAGEWLLDKLAANQPGVPWALGRLGARVPVAGAAQNVVPPEIAARWLEALLAKMAMPEVPFAVAQIARLSGDRARDLDEDLRKRAAAALARTPEWARAILEVEELGEKDEQRVFGESLPLGLHSAS